MAKSRHRKKKNKTVALVVPVATDVDVEIIQETKSVETLLDEADAELNSFNYEQAEAICKEILQIDSTNAKSLEMLSGIYIEQFKWEEAENLLMRCIELSPDTGYTKYFSMAQLCDGERSLKLYQNGIEILEKDLENTENIEPPKEVSKSTMQRVLSDAYCSVGEIFMTDCCFEENAEEKCKAAIDNAVKADPLNPEAYQCLTNFHLIKEQLQDAKSALEKSLSLWLPHHEALRDGESSESNTDADTQFCIPVYDSRIKTSKLLIELEMFSQATQILEGLVEEDDEVVEVWYLLGWLSYLQGDDYGHNSRYYLKKAKEVGIKTKICDEDQMSHIKELLEELNTSCPSDDEDNVEEDVEPEFSSDSDSESNKMET